MQRHHGVITQCMNISCRGGLCLFLFDVWTDVTEIRHREHLNFFKGFLCGEITFAKNRLGGYFWSGLSFAQILFGTK